MPMMIAAGIGAVGSIAGGLLSKPPAPPKFNPYDVTSGLGTVDFTKGKKGQQGSIVSTLSPEQQAFANQYGGLASQYLGQQEGTPWMGQAGAQIPGLFQGQLGASGVDYGSLQQYMQQMGGAQQGMQGLFGGAMGAGQAALQGPIIGSQQANQMYGMGQNLMGQNYQDVYQNRLGLLREQAQPYEQRAQDAFLGRQYAMGRMGSTGGQRDIQAFSQGLGQADTTRQLDAMGLSEQLYGRDQAMGAGLMGQGMQGLMQGYGAQTGAAQGWLGMGGNIQQALGGMYGQGFGAQQGMNELVNQRAQQRMANAQNLFGFGQAANLSNIQTGSSLQGQQVNLYNQLQQQTQAGQLAGQGTLAQGVAQNNAYQPSIFGSALQGFGNAMMANPSGYAGFGQGVKNLFGGGTQVGLSPGMQSQAYGQINALPGAYMPSFATPSYSGAMPSFGI